MFIGDTPNEKKKAMKKESAADIRESYNKFHKSLFKAEITPESH